MFRIVFIGVNALLIISVALASRRTSILANGLEREGDRSPAGETKPSGAVEFKLVAIGNGVTNDGIPAATNEFVASDGKNVMEYAVRFPSTLRATQELQHWIGAHGSKVLERGPNLDKHGNKVGERILLLSDSSERGKTLAVLVRTYGVLYRDVRSESLQDVLAFERQKVDENE